MKKILFLASVLFTSSYSGIAQTTTITPITLTGFNADIVADGTGPANLSTTASVDQASKNNCLVAQGFINGAGQSPTSFLPANGTINSVATSGLSFQLAPYSGNNSLKLVGPAKGTLTFATPIAADQVYVLATSVYGLTASITVNFSDGTTQAFTQNVPDWVDVNGTGFAIKGISRVNRGNDAIDNQSNTPRLYQISLALSAANKTKTIQSVTFNNSASTIILHVMAVTTKAFVNNDVAVTAITVNSDCRLTSQEPITVTVTNTGTSPQSNIPVSYQINGTGPIINETIAGPIAPGASATYTFTAKANLSAIGSYSIVGKTALTADAYTANDATTIATINPLQLALPITLDFETATTGMSALKPTVYAKSSVIESTGASNGTGTKGLIMDGAANTGWVVPAGTTNPWSINTINSSSVKMCFNPAGGNATDPLWLSFDLKQLFKTSNVNTNLRVLVNGTPVGGNQGTSPANTYRPPFSGSPIAWQRINIDLSVYKSQPNIEISFESSVSEAYANGAGTANLIDNIMVTRSSPTGMKENVLESLDVMVYPNPSNGLFNITLPQGKGYEMTVTDLTGKVVKQLTSKDKNTTLNMNNAAKGIYFLKITGEGKTAIRKIEVE